MFLINFILFLECVLCKSIDYFNFVVNESMCICSVRKFLCVVYVLYIFIGILVSYNVLFFLIVFLNFFYDVGRKVEGVEKGLLR